MFALESIFAFTHLIKKMQHTVSHEGTMKRNPAANTGSIQLLPWFTPIHTAPECHFLAPPLSIHKSRNTKTSRKKC